MEKKETWNEISVKEKFQLLSATGLITAAVALAFVSFIVTLTIGAGVIAAIGTFLASALGLFGIGMYVKNSLMDIETKVTDTVNKAIHDDDARVRRTIREELKNAGI